MEYIVKYLSNPLKTGVYNSQFKVNFSGLEKLFRDLAEQAKKKRARIFKDRAEDFTKTADTIKEGVLLDEDLISEKLEEAIRFLASDKECPKGIPRYFGVSLPRDADLTRTRFVFIAGRLVRRSHRLLRKIAKPLDSRLFRDIPDVAFIDKIETSKTGELVLDVTTIKEDGMSKFAEFIKCIPHIGKTLKKVKERRTFSSRYVFRPYALATQLWLGHESASVVPEDLRDFLKGAIRYYDSEEWRTSIVLSAITVESILADLYEEKYKEYAPNVPLGDLHNKVRNKMGFPQEITRAIEIVNESRIAAVHRSRFPVSDRESLNALHGATAFTMWYSTNF